jgi:formiminoglutamate deiminase
MPTLFFSRALLPSGFADDVRLTIDAGVITRVETGAAPQAAERIAGIALPGLPNLHCHAFQRGMAGLAETRGPTGDSFWTWRRIMYAFLDTLTPDDVEAIAAFAYAEMLVAGFTSVAEFHYLHHDPAGAPYANLAEMAERIAAAAAATGIGLTLLPSFYANGGFGGAAALPGQRRFLNDPARFAALLEASRRAIKPLPDAALGIAPHSLRAVTPETLREVVAASTQGPVHMHVAEQLKEVRDCRAWSGLRPAEWLLRNMDIGPRWVFIHATHMTPAETKGVAARGAVVGLCPLTEASLGDGIFNGPLFVKAGGRFGVGTDSNIELTAPGELKQLEYSQRLKHRGRNVMAQTKGQSSGRVLYEAALAGGAQALARRVGALAPGHRADIVVLDADHPDIAGLDGDRLLDAYVFVAGRAAVDSVWVGGHKHVSGGRHLDADRITARYVKTMARLKSL